MAAIHIHVGGAPAPHGPPEYYIVPKLDHTLVFDVTNASHEQGATVHLRLRTGAPNQRWRTLQNGTVQNVHSGLFLDIAKGVKEGHDLIQYASHGGDNQAFRFSDDGKVHCGTTKLVLDIKGGKAVHGAEIIAYKDHGGENQKFFLQRA